MHLMIPRKPFARKRLFAGGFDDAYGAYCGGFTGADLSLRS